MIDVQSCQTCGQLQYPRRDVCRNCLSDDLVDSAVVDTGTILAVSTLWRSNEPRFASKLPLYIAKADLDCGIHVICFAAADMKAGDKVRVSGKLDETGQKIWIAHSL
ncbi:Zn-ribbon domain-containing OB-fold protein [Novosphingobium mathurense]|uniref:Uncharacterized OB-fold protein, contains Zn-ribbon domain n=1 Tax=Novosphingobium mathurense TaxID=428990 RepID=A0A1U6HZN7_9SPHN|nr:zinc ribbon domain-containing protein [Novosphingobium mathurense]SLK01220.1 Uncharacterized OB-fold protein, contains Zn-ribbon domain [Novosphingobium mathurense]